MKISKIDFSIFHDLMHWPFTRHCRESYPYGFKAGIHHLRETWHYRRYDQLRTPLRRWLYCPRGKHDIQVWYSGTRSNPTIRPECQFCGHIRPPSEHDLDNLPPFMDD